MKIIYMLSGPPGSGKSYWVKKDTKDKIGTCIVSRDDIRFSFLNDSDNYFAREDEVFDKWIDTINKLINNIDITDIYLDATHLNDASRFKTLSQLELAKVDEIILVIMDTPLETCLKRNSTRVGRRFVPEDVIKKMYKSFKPYTENELFTGTIRLKEE